MKSGKTWKQIIREENDYYCICEQPDVKSGYCNECERRPRSGSIKSARKANKRLEKYDIVFGAMAVCNGCGYCK